MTSSKIIGSLGLVLDIIGVVILVKTGLPNKAIRKTAFIELFDIAMAKRYDRYSLAAMVLLIVGFALQLTANFL
jgi:hypothetical protein